MRIAMISIYPPKSSKHSSAIASYTHNIVNSISKNGIDTIVFSDIIQNIEKDYTYDNVKIRRCWKRGIMYPFQIFFNIFTHNVDVIHIQHEFFLFGSGISAVFFPVLQILLKLTNKPVVVTMHGIVPLSKLNNEFIKQNKLKGKNIILKSGLYLLTKLIIKLSSCTIVHEDKLKSILKDEYKCDTSKIHTIHHGIESRNDLIENYKAKQILGYQDKKVILFFGYLAGYKGIELLIDTFNHISDDFILIIAGGEPSRLKDDESYKNYIEGLKKRAFNTGKNIIFTGFIPEENIATYFSAADLVIFPYTVFMAGSGSISLCLAYLRPFIVSEEFKDWINFDELTFRNDAKDLAKKINMFFDKDSHLKEYSLNLCKNIRKKRLWSSIAYKTCELYKKL